MNDNDRSLKEVLEEWVNNYPNREKFLNGKVLSAWDSIVGSLIARETIYMYIRNKVLIVKITSEALRNELEYAKRKLVRELNKEAGSDVITDIRFEI